MAHTVTTQNRADVLLVSIIDHYVATNALGTPLESLWKKNRPMFESYIQKHIGPLMEQPTISGPAAAGISLLDEWINTHSNFVLRAAWGRYKPAVAEHMKREFARAGF